MDINCDCDLLTTELVDSLVGAVWAAEGDGWTSEKGAWELQGKIEDLAAGCGIARDASSPLRRYIKMPEKAEKYITIKDKKNKLVGVETSEGTANAWATNMREHSGENITIIRTGEGFALYREE